MGLVFIAIRGMLDEFSRKSRSLLVLTMHDEGIFLFGICSDLSGSLLISIFQTKSPHGFISHLTLGNLL
jgi:hypothetical protein